MRRQVHKDRETALSGLDGRLFEPSNSGFLWPGGKKREEQVEETPHLEEDEDGGSLRPTSQPGSSPRPSSGKPLCDRSKKVVRPAGKSPKPDLRISLMGDCHERYTLTTK
jgi:hypothetical protein